ncbi:uncharacterized protein [Equus caballus]|uniref:uncharacterized protein n=1 Tax=Equus caballus TaxID=9796 RepID=UPI0038B3F992
MRRVPAWWPEEESLFLWSRLLRLHKDKRDNETRSSVLEPFGLRGAGLPDPRAERVAGALCRLRCSHWAAGSSASPCPDGAASYTQARRLRPGTEDRGGGLSPRHARPAAEAPFLRECTSTDHVRKHAARRNSARLYEGTQARSQLITKTRADVTRTSARGPPPIGEVSGLPRPQGTRAQQAQSGPGDQRLGAVSCTCLLLAEAPGSTNAGPEIPPLALGGCSPPPFACLLCTRHSPRLWKLTLQVHRRKLHHKAPAVTHELLCRHCLGVVPAHRGWPSRVGTLGVSVNFWQPPHLHSYHKPEKHLQSGAGRGSIPCFHLLSFSNIFFTVLSL